MMFDYPSNESNLFHAIQVALRMQMEKIDFGGDVHGEVITKYQFDRDDLIVDLMQEAGIKCRNMTLDELNAARELAKRLEVRIILDGEPVEYDGIGAPLVSGKPFSFDAWAFQNLGL